MLNFAFYKPDPVAAAIQTENRQAEFERQQRFHRAWRAYQRGLPRPLHPLPDGTDDSIILSYPRITVDKGVSALFGEETCFWTAEKFPLDADGEPIEPPEQEYLDKLWKQNKKMTLLHTLGVNGGVFGHPFLKVRKQAGYEFLRVLPVCPDQMQAFWNPEDISDVWEFRETWGGVNPRTGKAEAHRERTIKNDSPIPEGVTWTVIREMTTEGNAKWIETGRENWPFMWSPVFHCQNLMNPNEFWGLSDIEPDVLSLNHATNFIASNLNRTLYFHTDPKLVGKGFQPDAPIDTSNGNIIILPSPDATLEAIELQSDYAGVQNFFDRIKDSYDEVTRIPPVARGKVENAGQLSGVALSILYSPLLEKTNTKRMLYGDMLSDLCRRLCEYGGVNVPDEIYIKWGNPMPNDELSEAQAYQLHHQLGVSTQTILDKLGYDAETEMAQRQEEDQQQADMQAQADAAVMAQNFSRGVA